LTRLVRCWLALCLTLAPAAGAAQENGAPLTAIDWLERALNTPQPPAIAPEPPRTSPNTEAPVLPESHFEAISVLPLSGAEQDATGLFTAERIGLPRDFWGPTPITEIVDAIAALPADTLPSSARLGLRLLMAEFAPPADLSPATRGALLLARIDKLIALGALQQASQLIEAAQDTTVALRERAFDIALLLGEEDRACAQMSGQITARDGQAAQIFCMARRGDWQSAYSSLVVAKSLGMIESSEGALLMRFLEEEEIEFTPPPPQTITPLGWRIMEALGDPVTTAGLPVAFAHADLRGTSGWRAQLDAAERLTRIEAVQPNRLFGLYTQRRPAASGGLWERVRAVQTLERAIASRNVTNIGTELIAAWPLFAAVELENAFATTHAQTLADLPLTGPAAHILWEMLLLAQDRIDRAAALEPDTELARFVMALAKGAPLPEITSPQMAAAIHLGFQDTALPDPVQSQLQNGELGLVLLGALDQIAQAATGDLHAATLGLQRLHALGLDAEARQIAVEMLLLDRRG